MGTYYFSVFGICFFFFFNIDFNALLAWLDIFPSSQAAACAKPGSKLRCPGGTLTLSAIPTSKGKTSKPLFIPLKSHAEPPLIRDRKAF